MRHSNQFDPDLYGDPPPRKAGCSPLMMLLMIGFCFFVYVQLRGAANAPRQRPVDQTGQVQRRPEDRRIRIDPSQSNRRADSRDWSIEEVESTNRAAELPKSAVRSDGLLNEDLPDPRDPRNTAAPRDSPTTRSTESRRTDRGDWSIEEVESEKPSPSKPKSTKKGDWSIEEVAK